MVNNSITKWATTSNIKSLNTRKPMACWWILYDGHDMFSFCYDIHVEGKEISYSLSIVESSGRYYKDELYLLLYEPPCDNFSRHFHLYVSFVIKKGIDI
jgi:hypothetical protein